MKDFNPKFKMTIRMAIRQWKWKNRIKKKRKNITGIFRFFIKRKFYDDIRMKCILIQYKAKKYNLKSEPHSFELASNLPGENLRNTKIFRG